MSGLVINMKLNSKDVCLLVFTKLSMFMFAHSEMKWVAMVATYKCSCSIFIVFASWVLQTPWFHTDPNSLLLLSPLLSCEKRYFLGVALTFPVSSSHIDAFCQTLVDTLEGTPGLRYIWSTFKPLLQGKVLYTPDTPAAHLIVKEVGLERKIVIYLPTYWLLMHLESSGIYCSFVYGYI